MSDPASGNVYNASDQETVSQQQYVGNAFYGASPSSSSNPSVQSNYPLSPYEDLHIAQRNIRRESSILPSYNVHQQGQLDLESSYPSLASLQQGSRHTLPPNLNSSAQYYHSLSSNNDAEQRVVSYPSNAYSGPLSGHFNTTEAPERLSGWFVNPPNFDPRRYRRSSTFSNSSFATSAARLSGTSFATTASTRSSLLSNETYPSARSSLLSNDTYGPTKYEELSSAYVAEIDNTPPAVASAPPESIASDPGRPFQCTYNCGKTFAKRHEWKRHEDSIHETQWKYICKPELLYPGMHCQFCGCVVDHAHLELNHQNRLCQELDDKSKHTFSRKDKFQLHVHQRHCPNHKAKKQWQKWAQPTDPRSEGYGCGFCEEHLPSWNVRAKHIGDHFEKDAPRFTMERWNKSYDVGIYGSHGQSQKSAYASQSTSQNTDFYAESKALSDVDGESQGHTPPASQYNVPRHRSKSSRKAIYGNRRMNQEEEDVYMEDDPGGETLFGDEMDYVE